MPENENQRPNSRFIVVSSAILTDNRLTPTEKLVYARACAFEEFFESTETTAEFVGKSAKTVADAKRKLEKYGYLECIRNTGRGKTYRAAYPDSAQTYPKRYVRPTENGKSDLPKTVTIDKNIEENKNLDTKVSNANGAVEYGNKTINELIELFEQVTGRPITSRQQAQRRACYNLLRRKDIGREKLTAVIEKVLPLAVADPYAPQINGFVDLQAKWDALGGWVHRKQLKQSQPRGGYSGISAAVEYERRPYDVQPRQLTDNERISDRPQVSESVMSAWSERRKELGI